MLDNMHGVTIMFVSRSPAEDGRDYGCVATLLSHIPQSVATNCGSVLQKIIRIKLYVLEKLFVYFLHAQSV
jgi:hypothetical protein